MATVFLFAFSAALSVVSMLGAVSVAHAADSVSSTLTMPPNNLGLVAHWTFDGPTISGTTVTDVSGSGNNGTMVNGPTVTPGVEGQALSFNGVSQYVNLGSPADLNISATTGKFTLSAWVYPIANPTGPGVITEMYYPNNTTVEYEIGYGLATCGTSALMVGFYQPSPGWTTAIGAAPVLNKWQLITGTFDGTTLRLYLNGQQVATDVPGVAMPSSAYYQNVTIGRRHDTACSVNYFPGKIDDPHIYNRALSASEITQLYNLGTASHQNTTVNPPNLQGGLVGHWTFDGPTISGTTVKDVSGNNNNGTMVNGPTPVAGVLGQALSFNGTSQYADIPNSTSLTPGPSVTVSAWVKPAGTGRGDVVTKWQSVGGVGTSVSYNLLSGAVASGKFSFFISHDGAYTTLANATAPSTYTVGEWYLVTGSYDGANVKLYINGTLVATTAYSSGMYSGTSPIGIGQTLGDATTYFSGSIDDVRIYNRALSASEIKQLYNLGR